MKDKNFYEPGSQTFYGDLDILFSIWNTPLFNDFENNHIKSNLLLNSDTSYIKRYYFEIKCSRELGSDERWDLLYMKRNQKIP